jgi:tetratricopeptide (TPR) repeat protein
MLADISLRRNDLSQAFVHLKKGFAQDDVTINRKMQLIQGLEPYAFGPGEDQVEVKNGLSDLYKIIYDETLKNDTLHYRYGVFLRESKAYTKAAEQFQKVTELNPANYKGWRELLHIQDDLEQYASMVKNGEAAIDVYPSQAEIYLLTGIAARKTGDLDAAEEWLFLGKDLVVNDQSLASEFSHQIGRLHSDKKEYDSAILEFEKAAKLDPFNGNIYGAKAEALLALGKDEAAIAEVQSGLDQAPTSPFLLDAMGQLYFKMEKYDRAISYFSDAIVFDNQALIVEHLGDALFKKGEKDKAVENWNEAKNLGRDTPLLNKKIADQTYYEH